MRCIAMSAVAALAVTAAAAPAPIVSGEVFVRLPGAASAGGKGEQLEVQSFHWGSLNRASGGGANRLSMDDSAGAEKLQPGGGQAQGAVGANRTLTVDGDRTETASGQATGKRQHKPLRTRAYYDAPLPRGSVWIRVASPWTACRVGARYPSLELGRGTSHYVLGDVVVAGCAADSIALNYAKVTVRGWDPEKKQ